MDLSLASLIASHLRSLSPRARTRTLDADAVAEALARHEAAVAAHPGVEIRTRLHGGYVANCYRGGESDRLQLETDAEGRTTYHASRTWAEHTPHGRGDTLRTWVLGPGGALKRAA